MKISDCVSRILLALTGFAAAQPGCAQTLISTVHVGYNPQSLAINRNTNTIYVANQDNSVSVVNGNTHNVVPVLLGAAPGPVAVNPNTNAIYTALPNNNAVAVINGANLQTFTIPTGRNPVTTNVDSIRNRIYAANKADATVTAIDGSTRQTNVIPAGNGPAAMAVNSDSNAIYIADGNSGTITVINGWNFSTNTVPAGNGPSAVAVDSLRNMTYVANSGSNTVSVIDGTTNLATVGVGARPSDIAVNVVTNQIYVANRDDSTMTVVDGNNNFATTTISNLGGGINRPQHLVVDQLNNQIYVLATSPLCLSAGVVYRIDGAAKQVSSSIPVGYCANSLAMNEVTRRLYVTNASDHSVSVLALPGTPSRFVPVTPCRVVDTRWPNNYYFGAPALVPNSPRPFYIAYGGCPNIPLDATAYSLNLTVVPHGPLGYVTVWPWGLEQPAATTLNSFDGRVKANALIVPAGAGSAIGVFATNETDAVIDINGYFVPPSDNNYGEALAFYPVPPCRVADTRDPHYPEGYLRADVTREFQVLSSNCLPPGAQPQAYSMNFTAVPHGPLWHLTVWPADQWIPPVSTLNSWTGAVVANAAIVPAASNGNISAQASNDTDLVIDVNGYFAQPSKGGLSLYPVSPCRAFDSRTGNGAFYKQITVPIASSVCEPPASTPQSYVLNATVVPQGGLWFLSLWPDGGQQPSASNLNAWDGAVTSNMAIVSPGANGVIDAYAEGWTNLILDISSFFAP